MGFTSNTTQKYTSIFNTGSQETSNQDLSSVVSVHLQLGRNFGQKLLHNELSQTQWLRTVHVNYLQVPAGRASKVSPLRPWQTHLTEVRAGAAISADAQGSLPIIQVVGRTQFLAVTKLRFSFLCCLSAGGDSQRSEATHVSSTPGPLTMTAKFLKASRKIPLWSAAAVSYVMQHKERRKYPITPTGLPALKGRRFCRADAAGAESWKPSQSSFFNLLELHCLIQCYKFKVYSAVIHHLCIVLYV